MEGGQVGTNFMMTEEDYDIHRLASMWFFLGPRGDTRVGPGHVFFHLSGK